MSQSPPRTLVEALERLPDDPGRGFRFIGSDRQERYFPYAELRREANRRAALLAAEGVRPGDRVALVVAEGHEFVLSFLAVVVSGAVPVPIFPRATFKASEDYVDTVAHIAEASGATRLLTLEATRSLVEPATQRVDALSAPTLVEELFAPDAEVPPFNAPAISPDDLCFLQFTSGSTAKPKGVAVTHANLVANTRAILGPAGLDRRDDDLGVSWLPLFHDMGLIGFILGTIIMDIPVVILPTATFARGPRVWLETIAKYRATITYAPNFAYALALKRLRERDLAELDLSSVRVAGCGAEPIQADTLRNFARALAPAGFDANALLPSYGMAESTLAITFHPRGTPMITDRVDPSAMQEGRAVRSSAENALELVSCGVPFPEHELRIHNEQGEPLGERQVGEIVTRGPSVTAGYYQRPDATAETFVDGWLRTGDLGYLADGNLYICGRIKDLIIIRGANFHPQDLEWAVSEIEGVRRGNVVAFGSLQDGEERLVLVAECHSSDAEAVARGIAARVNEAFGLSVHAVITAPVGSLPKTSSGKVQRNKTRSLYERGELTRHP